MIPGREDSLEKELATHSSTLAWEIPWTEEPGRLHSMGSQTIRHNIASEYTCTHNSKYALIWSNTLAIV